MHEVASSKAPFRLLITLLAVSVFVNFVQEARVQNLQRTPPSTKWDKDYVSRAATYWAMKNGMSPARAMEGRYPKVMYIADNVCVSLETEIGGAGEAPVYCFDAETKRLTRKEDNVE